MNSTAPGPHSTRRVNRAPRLLLVDDNADNLEITAIMLRSRYDVVTCQSGADAIAMVDEVDPDLLVLDIGMSPMDGIACLEAIRAMPRHARTPAIALTAFARDAEQQAFLGAGFQSVITKPILDERLLELTVAGVLASAGRQLDPSPERPA
jgi:CheY-like chemotaxis protein